MLLGFKPRFAPKILSHEKRHTIRGKRKIRPRVGETCHLYTGLRQRGPIIQELASGEVVRQKVTRLLGRFLCVKVQDIEITVGCDIYIDGVCLDRDERNALATSDGFSNFEEMMKFWDGRLPFVGDIIHWDPEVTPLQESKKRK